MRRTDGVRITFVHTRKVCGYRRPLRFCGTTSPSQGEAGAARMGRLFGNRRNGQDRSLRNRNVLSLVGADRRVRPIVGVDDHIDPPNHIRLCGMADVCTYAGRFTDSMVWGVNPGGYGIRPYRSVGLWVSPTSPVLRNHLPFTRGGWGCSIGTFLVKRRGSAVL
jgi:hypothetical protein